jgi:hypothetical protein
MLVCAYSTIVLLPLYQKKSATPSLTIVYRRKRLYLEIFAVLHDSVVSSGQTLCVSVPHRCCYFLDPTLSFPRTSSTRAAAAVVNPSVFALRGS